MPTELFWAVPRLLNAALAIFTIVVLTCRLRSWIRTDPVLGQYGLGLLALLVWAAEGSIEQIVQHSPLGPRVALGTIALTWTAIAAGRSLRKEHRPDRAHRTD